MEIRKKEGEPITSLMFRFNKRIRQSGVLREVRKRRFKDRDQNKTKRRASAIYRSVKKDEVLKLKKLGKI
ncbi:MAG: 30S ribosomal protein S21 [Candidatus Pacebacteria bacterium]|nr:30S ribosomal protein S21 [Candidatus Paceibacterota bacterium]